MSSTSAATYQAIKDSGLVGELQLQVLKALAVNGPLTSGELAEFHIKSARVSVSPRLAELKNQGAVAEKGKRPCRVTGRECVEWDLTGNLPRKLTPREQLLIQISNTEAKLAKLKAKLGNL
jgi:hypothetical protein